MQKSQNIEKIEKKRLTFDEADPSLNLYHSMFRRSTKKLREIYQENDEKNQVVIEQIFRDRNVPILEPGEIELKVGREDFEQRQAEKLERYEELAAKNHQKSSDGFEQARKMGDVIPFGQPILVGHHSEKGHRNLLKKIDNKMRNSIEDGKKGDYYDNKVKNIESTSVISGDDPEALTKLKEKIASLQKDQLKLRAVKVNKNAKSCFDEDSQNWKSVQLNSISAEIRRCKKRIEQLIAKSQIEQVDETVNGINLVVDQSENRVMLYFPGKPSEEVRTKLKRNGFRWSPRNSAWQAYISSYAIMRAREIIKEVKN